MLVMKFGGASLADSNNFSNAVDWIVKQKEVVVVVSAMKNVTNELVQCLDLAKLGKYQHVSDKLSLLRESHTRVVRDLIKQSESLDLEISALFVEARTLLQGVASLQEITPRAHDRLLSLGEKLSSRILAAAIASKMQRARAIEGEQVLLTDNRFTNAYPNYQESKLLCGENLIPLLNANIIPVVAGFTGATKEGLTTTLGRGGTDLTASVLAHCLNATECWFLKEVDGIMTTDPKLVQQAHSIKEMSYREVAELSFFGAKVLHPIAIHPLKISNIPARILNVYKHDFSGTVIKPELKDINHPARAISSLSDVGLITIEGDGMQGVVGLAGRVFHAVAQSDANILMISQSSSEQNICLVVRGNDAQNVVQALELELELEMVKGLVEKVKLERNYSIISLVGEGMAGFPGISGHLFSILGEAGINVKMIAQGSSEVNISFMISSEKVSSAMIQIHEGLGL